MPTAADAAAVDAVIFDELIQGVASEAGLATIRRVLDALIGQGAETVLLGCTDLTLLADRLTEWPTVDTTVLHARAAGELACRNADLVAERS